MSHFRAVCGSIRHRAVHEVEQDEVELDDHTEEDMQIYMVNTNFIHFHAKGPGIIAKLKTSSYQDSVKIHIK